VERERQPELPQATTAEVFQDQGQVPARTRQTEHFDHAWAAQLVEHAVFELQPAHLRGRWVLARQCLDDDGYSVLFSDGPIHGGVLALTEPYAESIAG
jgi:hypothetical protein